MPSVSDFIVDRATVSIGDGDEPLTVTYRPGRLDQDRIDRFFDAVRPHDEARADVLAASYLLAGYGTDDGLIIGWNLTGPLEGRREKTDDAGNPVKDERGRVVMEPYVAVPAGEPVPVHADYLRFLPANYLIQMFSKIQEHAGGFSARFFEKTTTGSLNGSLARS